MGLDIRSEMATRPRYKQAAPLTWRVGIVERGARGYYLQMPLRREAANLSRMSQQISCRFGFARSRSNSPMRKRDVYGPAFSSASLDRGRERDLFRGALRVSRPCAGRHNRRNMGRYETRRLDDMRLELRRHGC
jgi:hypothetical protein